MKIILAVIVFIYIHTLLFTQGSCIYMAQFSCTKTEHYNLFDVNTFENRYKRDILKEIRINYAR